MEKVYPSYSTDELRVELLELQSEVAFQREFQAELFSKAFNAAEMSDSEAGANYADIHDQTRATADNLQYRADETEAHIMDRTFDISRERRVQEATSLIGRLALSAFVVKTETTKSYIEDTEIINSKKNDPLVVPFYQSLNPLNDPSNITPINSKTESLNSFSKEELYPSVYSNRIKYRKPF